MRTPSCTSFDAFSAFAVLQNWLCGAAGSRRLEGSNSFFTNSGMIKLKEQGSTLSLLALMLRVIKQALWTYILVRFREQEDVESHVCLCKFTRWIITKTQIFKRQSHKKPSTPSSSGSS